MAKLIPFTFNKPNLLELSTTLFLYISAATAKKENRTTAVVFPISRDQPRRDAALASKRIVDICTSNTFVFSRILIRERAPKMGSRVFGAEQSLIPLTQKLPLIRVTLEPAPVCPRARQQIKPIIEHVCDCWNPLRLNRSSL